VGVFSLAEAAHESFSVPDMDDASRVTVAVRLRGGGVHDGVAYRIDEAEKVKMQRAPSAAA
jgi:hypothetical protein